MNYFDKTLKNSKWILKFRQLLSHCIEADSDKFLKLINFTEKRIVDDLICNVPKPTYLRCINGTTTTTHRLMGLMAEVVAVSSTQ